MSGRFGHTNWKGLRTPQRDRAISQVVGYEISKDVPEAKPVNPVIESDMRWAAMQKVRSVFQSAQRPMGASTDPFLFNRMMSHARNGLLRFEDIPTTGEKRNVGVAE